MVTEFDAVVIGTGVAGTAAAASLCDASAATDVALVERAPEDESGGNSRYTGAYMRLQEDGSPVEGFVEGWMEYSNGKADRELIETVAANSKATIQWLEEKGIEFNVSKSSFPSTNRPHFGPVGGGAEIIDTLTSHAVDEGVTVLYETTAEELSLNEAGAIDGVHVRDETGRRKLEADVVVVACGGFEGNKEMLSKYIDSDVYDIDPVAPGGYFNKGEGIKMAESVGAKLSGQFDSFHNEPVDPRSEMPEAAVFAFPYGILVNSEGERFVDEAPETPDEHYEPVCRAIRNQPGEIGYLIADQRLFDIPEIGSSIMTDIEPFEASPDYGTADPLRTIVEQIAAEFGIDETLHETIQDYNDAVDTETEFDPLDLDGKTARTTPVKSNWALPLDTPPFVVFPIVSANVFTFGGIAVDEHGQVVDADDRPIDGLYAAGEVTGLHYGQYFGATSVLRGLVFGRLAGRHASKRYL